MAYWVVVQFGAAEILFVEKVSLYKKPGNAGESFSSIAKVLPGVLI